MLSMKEIFKFNKIGKLEKKLLLVSLVVIVIGIFVSIYLWYEYSKPTPIICATDCEKVRDSKYANLYGISMPFLGLVYYLFLLALTLTVVFKKRINSALKLTVWSLAVGGLFFSIYLTYLEIWVIEAICQWCVVSAICTVILFIVSTNILLIKKQDS